MAIVGILFKYAASLGDGTVFFRLEFFEMGFFALGNTVAVSSTFAVESFRTEIFGAVFVVVVQEDAVVTVLFRLSFFHNLISHPRSIYFQR